MVLGTHCKTELGSSGCKHSEAIRGGKNSQKEGYQRGWWWWWWWWPFPLVAVVVTLGTYPPSGSPPPPPPGHRPLSGPCGESEKEIDVGVASTE